MTKEQIEKLAQFTIKKAGLVTDMAKSFSSAFQTPFGKGALTSLGMLGTTFLVQTIISLLADKGIKKQKASYFEKMLEAHPQLAKLPPEQLVRYWESLFRFAPTLAADPLGAGAYITQAYARVSGDEFGGPGADMIKTLADIQKSYKEGQPPVMSFQDTFRILKDLRDVNRKKDRDDSSS